MERQPARSAAGTRSARFGAAAGAVTAAACGSEHRHEPDDHDQHDHHHDQAPTRRAP